MSIAKTGALPESYKYVTIAIDSFDGHLLQGRLYHDSIEEGTAFECVSEMALQLEAIFDGIHYPMKSVDQRSFMKGGSGIPLRYKACDKGNSGQDIHGRLGEYRLHVKYRFHATWQGDIVNLRDGSIFCFSSFLVLMEYLNSSLGHEGADSQYGLGKRMCEVAVRSFDHFVMAGDVSHPAVETRQAFASEFELKEKIEHMLLPMPEGTEEGKVIIPRSVVVNAGSFGPMTFVVRVLFRSNATWQGTICWKEKRRQVSFRSFLEMLLLMQGAAAGREGWNEKLGAASGHMQ